MKKAIILGTYNPQVDAINYLHEQGWWVIGCGLAKTGKALEVLDQFEQVDLKDLKALADLARREKVDLFYSVAGEVALFPLSVIPQQLGLPVCLTPEQYVLNANKVKLRQFLNQHDVSPVQFRHVSNEADLEGWHCFPAMLKPVDNCGQRGIFRVESMDDLKASLQKSLEFSPSKTVIVEEFLEGPEVSAHAFVVDGEVVFIQFSDRLVLEGYPGGLPRGHIVPSQTCTAENLSIGEDIVKRSVKALKVQNGPVYFQMIVTPAGPKIVELMFRLDGCQIWRLIKMLGGVDLLSASLRQMMGEKLSAADFQMAPHQQGYKSTFFLSPPGEIFMQAKFTPPPDSLYHEYRYNDGEVVRPVNGYMEVIGYYITQEQAH